MREKEIEPAVAVVIEQAHAAARRLDWPRRAGFAALVEEGQFL